MSIEIILDNVCDAAEVPSADKIRHYITTAIGDRVKNAEIGIRIVSREESRELNHQYRGKDKATNILSFNYSDDDDEIFMGDLVICAAVVAEEAQQQHKPAAAHWAHMVVHGTLHLLGYDHEHDQDAETMEALETKVLQQLGYNNPYEEQ